MVSFERALETDPSEEHICVLKSILGVERSKLTKKRMKIREILKILFFLKVQIHIKIGHMGDAEDDYNKILKTRSRECGHF